MDSKAQNDRNRLGYQEGIVSVIVNTLLFGLKYWAGIVSGSVALLADAWHTLSDSLSSIIVLICVKLSSKKADNKHPFGYGRVEEISSLFIGMLLGIVAYEFMRESIQKIRLHESANFGNIAIIVTVLSIVLKEGLAQYAFRIGKLTDNSTIKADAWHHRSDALSSLVVLVGIFLRKYIWWIDSLLGIIVSLMLAYAVYEIMRDAIDKLLGCEVHPDLIEKIKNTISSTDSNMFPHHFHIHHYGIHKELTFHIIVDEKMNIKEAHDIATKMEDKIKEALDLEVTIHVEPDELSLNNSNH